MKVNITNSSSAANDDIDSSIMSLLERQLKFYTLLALQTPSLLCTLFIFYHFKWSQLQIQIYGFLLLVNALIVAVELSITLYFLHEGTIHLESRCAGWITLNYSLFQLSIYLMTWTSIERYLFIYHERFILQHIILLHYGPVAVLTVYCSLLYVGIVILHKCRPVYDVRLYICGGPCYSLELTLGLLDWVGNGMSMEISTLIVNVILIIRYLIQRHRMRSAFIAADRRQQWRRSVKLVMQLLAVAMLYVVAWIPYSIIVLVQMFANTKQLAYILSTFFAYIPYLQSLVLPYVCILFMPEIKQKFYALFTRLHFGQNRVQPTTGGRTAASIRTPAGDLT